MSENAEPSRSPPSAPPRRMRAAVQHRYGGPEVLGVEEIETPTPGAGEVLVRVASASVNAGDWHLMRGTPFVIRFMFGGILRPRIRTPGADVAGTVTAIGEGVASVAPGDEVIGELSESGFGGYAEYVCAPARAFARRPSNASWDQAAALPAAGRVALQAVRDVRDVGAGTRVLVNGASGGVGTYAVQIAKARGAHVTAVGGSGSRELLVRCGADVALEHTSTDVDTLAERFDLVVDAALYRSIRVARELLAPGGTYAVIGGSARHFFEAVALKGLLSRDGRRVVPFEATWNDADLGELRELVESGAVTPVVDRVYPLDDVADAVRHVESGHPRGKILLAMRTDG